MGLFDFVKNAGAALLGRDDEKEIEQKARAQAPDATAAAAAREKMRVAKMAAKLQNQLSTHDLKVENLDLVIKGDSVRVGGTVADQATREKVILTLGNNEGIASVDDQLEVTQKEPEATFYTVQRGDSLSKIAKAHYGNAMKYPVIFEANKPMLSDPDKIYPGQVLRIPPIDG